MQGQSSPTQPWDTCLCSKESLDDVIGVYFGEYHKIHVHEHQKASEHNTHHLGRTIPEKLDCSSYVLEEAKWLQVVGDSCNFKSWQCVWMTLVPRTLTYNINARVKSDKIPGC